MARKSGVKLSPILREFDRRIQIVERQLEAAGRGPEAAALRRAIAALRHTKKEVKKKLKDIFGKCLPGEYSPPPMRGKWPR